MKIEENILKGFFEENKKEIEDSGFSNRVMNRIPEKKTLDWIVVLFAGIGSALVLILAFVLFPNGIMVKIPAGIPVYGLLGFCLAFPLITMVFFLRRSRVY